MLQAVLGTAAQTVAEEGGTDEQFYRDARDFDNNALATSGQDVSTADYGYLVWTFVSEANNSWESDQAFTSQALGNCVAVYNGHALDPGSIAHWPETSFDSIVEGTYNVYGYVARMSNASNVKYALKNMTSTLSCACAAFNSGSETSTGFIWKSFGTLDIDPGDTLRFIVNPDADLGGGYIEGFRGIYIDLVSGTPSNSPTGQAGDSNEVL